MVALEKLARDHLESNPKWAEVWGAELSRLRTAERKAMRARVDRVLNEVASPKHEQSLAQMRHMRRRQPD
jgi:hypothetical protein